MRSIHSRLLIASSLVLAGFLGVTGFALDRAYLDSAAAAAQEKLQSRIYALLAAADTDEQGHMLLPEHLPERRLSEPDSGLYAIVVSADARLFWQSASLVGRSLEKPTPQPPGKRHFYTLNGNGDQLFMLDYGVSWEDDAGAEQLYTFVIAEDMAQMQAEQTRFRHSLWRWLGGMAMVLLIAQGWILRWGLHPLRGVAVDLQNIQRGTEDELQGDYPRELRGLTTSLNALLIHARSVQQRYRNSLDDLAHSLKTPLAYLSTIAEDRSKDCDQLRHATTEQVQRMDYIVQRQLQRAAASGRITLAKQVPVGPLIERVVRSLEKIYRQESLQAEMQLTPKILFQGDEGDLMEIVGNLLENAFKFAHSSIRISVASTDHDLHLSIEDDGPGIPAPRIDEVLQRGIRADQAVPGQGIGLAVVDEMVSLYAGKLKIGHSKALGGVLVEVWLPMGYAHAD